jgi:hypothetical protein
MTTFLLILFFIISVTANVILIWYIKRLFQKIFFISDNIDDLLGNLENFASHLETIHTLETYYGDETLQALIKHSRNIVEYVEGYKSVYSFTENEQTEEGAHDAEEV